MPHLLPSLLLGTVLLTVTRGTALAQSGDGALERLAVRVEAGDDAARRELMPIARRMMLEWNETKRSPATARQLIPALLAMAQPLTPLDLPPRDNEVDWRGPAVRALRWLVASDSGDVESITRLTRIAPYPYIWMPPERELAQLRALAARQRVVPAVVALAWFGLELEVGTTAGARAALDQTPVDSLSPAVRHHLQARLAFAEGDSAAGRAAYARGAAAIATPSDAAWFGADLRWFASDDDLKAWRALPTGSGAHAAWLAAFWDRRDLEDGRLPGSRLAAQFARWRVALRDYRWDLDGSVAEGLPVPRAAAAEYGLDDARFPFDEGMARMMYDNRYAPVDRVLDDRGRLIMRHGFPTERILPPGITSVAQETLVWSRGEGQVMVSFSRPEALGTVARLGMLARNYPVGDLMTLCRRQAQLCTLAGLAPAGQRYRAETIRQKFVAERKIAETTEGNPEQYRKGMAGIFQAYGLAGGGVLATMALPVDALRAGAKRGEDGLGATWRVVVGDEATGRIVATLDTVRQWQLAPGDGKGSYVTAYAVLPVPPGRYTVTMVAGDSARRVGAGGRVASVVASDRAGTSLQLADPILGRSGSGVSWRRGDDAVSLNPTNAWTRDDEAPLFYEIDGLVAGRSYAIEVELWEGGSKVSSPRTRLGFSLTATEPHHRGQQVVSFRQLKPGNYRLVLRVRDGVSGEAVERSRSVALR